MSEFHLILDCDGIIAESGFTYNSNGKYLKHFGCNDNLMMGLFLEKMMGEGFFKNVTVMSGDNGPGQKVTLARLHDMGLADRLITTFCNHEKYAAIKCMFPMDRVFYVADDIYDIPIFKEVKFAATTSNAPTALQLQADFISNRVGGQGALSEILWHIMEKQFGFAVVDLIEAKAYGAMERVNNKIKDSYLKDWADESWLQTALSKDFHGTQA